MPPNPKDTPVSKGRKSQTIRWLDVLPTGPSLSNEQDYNGTDHRPEDYASRGAAPQVAQLLTQYPRLQASRPRAQSGALRPASSRPQAPQIHSRTPSFRSHTPHNQFLTPSDRARDPSGRPQSSQSQVSLSKLRPSKIFIPPPSQTCQRLVAFNPAESTQSLDTSPMPHDRRNSPVHTSSGPDMLARLPRCSITSCGPIARGAYQSTDTAYMSVPRYERGLLIIGGSHREPTPYSAGLPPLLGVQNDRDRLRKAFQSRKYSVETMVEEEGHKQEILRRVGNFLASADAGDIRMIVFTGHAAKIGTDQRFAIIPSGCSSDDDTISPAEWQDTVLKNAGGGVIVISVFATCMSGAMAEQSVKLTNFDQINERASFATNTLDGPIQIILSSSGDTQPSFEYYTPPDSSSSSWHDYFLWALAEAAEKPDIDNWDSFVKTLQAAFTYVRATSFRNSSLHYPHDLDWLLRNPQTPRIFVSSQMPDFSRFLPRQAYRNFE